MSPRSITPNKASLWSRLPVELRDMVFGHLLTPRRSLYATYARVNKEWNAYWEPKLFRKLVLTPDDLEYLSEVFGGDNTRRLRYLHRLDFDIILEKYDCDLCDKAEDEGTALRNDYTMTMCLLRLLMSLHPLEPATKPSGEQHRVTLTITCFSRSDTKHHYKPLAMRLNSLTDEFEEIEEPESGRSNGHGPLPVDKHYECATRLFGSRRLQWCFGDGHQVLEPPQKLPEARIITDLSLDLASYRTLGRNVVWRLVQEGFPSLVALNHEQWLRLKPPEQLRPDENFVEMIGTQWPNTFPRRIQRLSLFSDADPRLHQGGPRPATHHEAGRSLALASQYLSVLTCGFAADAAGFLDDFFEDRCPEVMMRWEHLTKLCLTAACFESDTGDEISSLLSAAARAARRMPQLLVFEMWNCGNGQAARFCYETRQRTREGNYYPASIVWACTWSPACIDQSDPAIGEWRRLARDRSGGLEAGVRFSKIEMKPIELRTHLAMIPHLRLSTDMLCSTTHGRIKYKTRMRRDGKHDSLV
ncbi:uncharacterized protein F5Z01DRAFT_675722 [Emericellopsis atlantica]|uniref:DUF6546 domain-containing protein n=1 Tax=Emericellopsis atlantica TaxID=2614577 RepID=A0A9P7ZJ04_9HYPO|nr:uncharacterized protein F5Z01DRAFT_675722 [Emericellopsis atlantica]KAG9252602.1 hypothetical protein F5Z01DRAFT_675722 [Emericellopsis atlantica]